MFYISTSTYIPIISAEANEPPGAIITSNLVESSIFKCPLISQDLETFFKISPEGVQSGSGKNLVRHLCQPDFSKLRPSKLEIALVERLLIGPHFFMSELSVK